MFFSFCHSAGWMESESFYYTSINTGAREIQITSFLINNKSTDVTCHTVRSVRKWGLLKGHPVARFFSSDSPRLTANSIQTPGPCCLSCIQTVLVTYSSAPPLSPRSAGSGVSARARWCGRGTQHISLSVPPHVAELSCFRCFLHHYGTKFSSRGRCSQVWHRGSSSRKKDGRVLSIPHISGLLILEEGGTRRVQRRLGTGTAVVDTDSPFLLSWQHVLIPGFVRN